MIRNGVSRWLTWGRRGLSWPLTLATFQLRNRKSADLSKWGASAEAARWAQIFYFSILHSSVDSCSWMEFSHCYTCSSPDSIISFGSSYRWGQNSQQRSIYGHFSSLRLRLSSSPAPTSRMFQNQTAWNPIRDTHPHLSNSAADSDLLYSPEFCKIFTRFSKIFIIKELEIVKIEKVRII